MKLLKSLLLTLTLVVVTWCGVAQQRVVFSPQWIPQSQFAGYYVALEKGFYAEAGLDVEIKHPTTSMYAIDMLSSQESDFITSMFVDALVGVDQGRDMVNVMQLMPRSSMVILAHHPINGDAEALRGKRLATWTAGYSIIAIALLNESGIDVEWIKFLSGVNIFLSKSVDATTAMSYNEVQTIKETGFVLDETHTLRLADMGYNLPEDGLYTRSSFAKENPDLVRRFREASIRGWEWARDNREEAIDIVLKVAEQCNIPTNRYHQSKMLDEYLDQCVAQPQDGYDLRDVDYNETYQLLSRAGLIKNNHPMESFVFGGGTGK